MLEARPWHRVAHIHVVEHDGPQWRNYLIFRDLLRRDASARAAYESTKRCLLDEFAADRDGYAAGKRDTVERLLRGIGHTDTRG